MSLVDEMEENELTIEPDEPQPEHDEVIEVFEPRLTLTAKSFSAKRRGVNFLRLYVGFIDFAGDKSPELGGITVRNHGGLLLPAPDFPAGLKAVKNNGGDYLIEGNADGEAPFASFDLFPDGFNQSGRVTIEKKGRESVEVEFEFNPQPLNWLFDVVESLVWAFFIAMIIRLLFFQTFFIPSGSMEPTLFEGDRIVANKLIYKLRQPKRGEVVIFKVYNYFNELDLKENNPRSFMPIGPSSFTKDPSKGDRFILREYIKRVAALPGDEILIEDHQLYINGEAVDEPWVTDPVYGFNYEYGPVVIPEGHIFVLGDNHRNSQDSHKLGFLPLSNIVGEAILVFYPPKHLKLIR